MLDLDHSVNVELSYDLIPFGGNLRKAISRISDLKVEI
jgi:hypothetical protein